ncbi:MAG: GNAT family N-acetyltransferase [Armatimonadota bacterium]|nr:GNAT family N-acetyltransferase [Armatimonadota bacterium]
MNTVVVPTEPGAPHDPAALPPEWSAWAEEPGKTVRIEDGGAVLGVLHAVMVGRTEAWFEGLWVQPGARGRGVGRRLIAEAEALVRGHGAMVVRTAVPAREYAALAVAERTGFARHSQAVVLTAEIPGGPPEVPYEARVLPATSRETAAITDALAASAPLEAWRGLVPLGWRFRRLVPEMVRGLIKDDRVLRAGDREDRGPVLGAAIFGVWDADLVISVLAGPPPHEQALFGEALGRGQEAGARRVVVFAPDASVADRLRVALTPHAWCPDGLVIVEKALVS